MPAAGGATALAEQAESLVDARQDRRGTHRRDSGRGQLDSERDPVEAMAELLDGRGVVGGHREVVAGCLGALDEQPYRVVLARRPHDERRLAVDAESLLAGRENGDRGAAVHHQVDDARHRVDQVLAVVHHDQRLAPTQRTRKRLLASSLPTLGKSHRRRDRARHERVVVDCREVDEPRAVRVLRHRARGRLHRQACLPDTTRPGERHHP
jgi:hypothetical protein